MDAVREILLSYHINFSETVGNYYVSCPFHTHSGKKKKLGISKDGRMIHCWVCGKSGNWNTYADFIGLPTINKGGENKSLYKKGIEPLLGKIQEAVKVKQSINCDFNAMQTYFRPWKGSWRGISEELLLQLNAARWFDTNPESRMDRIIFPITISNVLKGYTAPAAQYPAVRYPKTRIIYGTPIKEILFPYDYTLIRQCKGVVLVEGEFDALRLISLGIPAFCVFGVNNWGPKKLYLLNNLKNIKKVIVLGDGDSQGYQFNRDTYLMLKKYYPNSDYFDLPYVENDRLDPGNMPIDLVKSIKYLLRR